MGPLMVPKDPVGHMEQLLFSTLLPEMALNPSKPCQDYTCPYASSVGVVEDRSVLMHSVHSSRLWCANCSNKNDSLDPLRPAALKYFQNIFKIFKVVSKYFQDNQNSFKIFSKYSKYFQNIFKIFKILGLIQAVDESLGCL